MELGPLLGILCVIFIIVGGIFFSEDHSNDNDGNPKYRF